MTSFGKAFSQARQAGKKTFTWQGKLYTTQLASEQPAPKNAPVPQQRPDMPPVVPPAPTQEEVQKAQASDDPSFGKKLGQLMIGGMFKPEGLTAVKRSDVAADPAPTPPPNQTSPDVQGPKPEGVWYASPGTPLSIEAARTANRPVPKQDDLIAKITKLLAGNPKPKAGGGW